MAILDTGDRTPMGNTGFVRDNHKGKGRMDLLPWHAIMACYHGLICTLRRRGGKVR